jgi:hypothetical protein
MRHQLDASGQNGMNFKVSGERKLQSDDIFNLQFLQNPQQQTGVNVDDP